MRYLSICLLFLFSCQSTSQEVPSKITAEEEKIAKDLILGAFDDLWGGIDSSKISNYHTDDFFILEHGEIWDNERVLEFIRKEHARANRPKRSNRMEFITIEKVGPAMTMAYHNFAEFHQGDSLVGKAQWLESALAVPSEDGWKIKSMHSTWVPGKK